LLLCDDEPPSGRFVKNVAEDLGYEVRLTTDGLEFMDTYETFAPSTSSSTRKCTARVIITGCAPDYATHANILAEFKGVGPVKTLHKPVEISRLRAALRSQESLDDRR
jgi:CheY-like chemotaxis protein